MKTNIYGCFSKVSGNDVHSNGINNDGEPLMLFTFEFSLWDSYAD